MKLVTADRHGLLAQVGLAFTICGVNLHAAKIATIGAEAEDTFFITSYENRPLEDPDKLRCLENCIHDRLDEKIPAPSTATD